MSETVQERPAAGDDAERDTSSGTAAPAPSPAMMRRRAVTASVATTAAVAATLVTGRAPWALAAILAYVVLGGGRAGLRLTPRWYEPAVSGALACVAAVCSADLWWAIAFLCVAVAEACRSVVMLRGGDA